MSSSRVRAFLTGAAGALFVLVAAAVIIPQYSDYTTRVRASEVLLYLRQVQDRVSSQAVANKSVSGSGAGVSQLPEPPLKDIMVLPDGMIIAVSLHFGQVFVLIPSYSSGSVSWRCIAGSSKDVPQKCRA